MLWLTAPVLLGRRAAVALGSFALDPYLMPSRIARRKANGLKGKWPVEKEKQPKTDKRAWASTVSHPCSQTDCSSGPWAQEGFTPHLCREPGNNPQLAASPSGSATPATPAHAQQCPLHCSGPHNLGGKILGGCCGHCSSSLEMKTLQYGAWYRWCLHMQLFKSCLKISLTHLIFLLQGKFFTCLVRELALQCWNLESHQEG